MSEILFGAVLAIAALAVVLPPLMRPRRAAREGAPEQEEIEARKEAKYRELRDTELDHAAGKLSEADYRRQRERLQREAIEILNELRPEPAQGSNAERAGPTRP